MLSQTGLGTEGTNKPTYLTAGETFTDPKLNAVVFNWADLEAPGLAHDQHEYRGWQAG